jgi:hypothetical protein
LCMRAHGRGTKSFDGPQQQGAQNRPGWGSSEDALLGDRYCRGGSSEQG